MAAHHTSKFLLALSFTILSVASQNRDTVYGIRMPNFSGAGATGGGTGSTGESGYSTAPSSSGPSGGSGGGRIVGNSILDLDEQDDENPLEMGYRQQTSGISPAMARPTIMTGPSVGSGQMLITDNELNSMSMEDRPRSNKPTLSPAMPSRNGNSNANTNRMQDRMVQRYISVHVPPPEPIIPVRSRPLQSTPKPETHYQIVFIKAPSVSPQELQEVQLPPPPQMKTLVYVLLKKPEMNDFVKISQPPKVKPTKPEVFFIQYKGNKQQKQNQGGSMMMMMNTPSNSGNGNDDMVNNNQGSRTRTASTTTTAPSDAGGMMQDLGGYDNSEIADSDFSQDSFNENEFSLSSFQRQNSNRQQQVRSGFSYSPGASRYGIVN